MKLSHCFLCLIIFMIPLLCTAQQGISYGFKVGLNFSTFLGDLEQDDAGNEIERLKRTTGFHVGAGVIYRFTDRFGIKGDFIFSQKGTQQFFEGQGVQLFYKEGMKEQIGLSGTQKRFLRMTNSYIEIPISGYGKFGKIEFFGGPYIAFLVASKAVGDYQFNSSLVELKADLNYNYFKDDIIDPSALDLNEEDYELFNINGQPVFYPEVATAYYDFQKKDGKFFNGIDYGLNAGIALYLNDGLYISANLNYGLADLSNDAFDHAYSRLSEDMRAYLPRKDVDKNFTIQASVGFAF